MENIATEKLEQSSPVARKLASVRKVGSVSPIPDADQIEVATVDGWQVVIKKDEFKPGDLGIYFEIDSFLPIEERYEFLRKSSYRLLYDKSEGFRLKTIKLKKQLSQGLLLPISLFPEIVSPGVGQDVTELLKIRKFEPPLPTYLRGKIEGYFPSFIRKTDQERIQNVPAYLVEHRDTKFELTVKLDGSSMTVYHNDGKVYPNKKDPFGEVHLGICSRNLEIKKDDETNAFVKCAWQLGLPIILLKFGRNLALQGELVGAGVQGNNEGIKGLDYFVFDVWDIDAQRYLLPLERIEILTELNITAQLLDLPKIKHVPILTGSATLAEVVALDLAAEKSDMAKVLAFADGPSLNPQSLREGVVFKNMDGERVSFKAVSNKFLLKWGDRE